MKKGKKGFIFCLSILALFLGGFGIFKVVKRSNLEKKIIKEVIKEVGSILTLQDFLKEDEEDVQADIDLSLLKQVGTYHFNLILRKEKFRVHLQIIDTTAPLMEVKDLTVYLDEPMPRAEDFITSVFDESGYKVQDIVINPVIGEQEVEIIVLDEYGNKTSRMAKVFLKEDKEPPVFDGLSMLHIELGDFVSLNEGVSAFDERFGKVAFSIDDSQVNYNVPGVYNIYYEAQDGIGNKVQEIRKIEIKRKETIYMIPNFPTFLQYPLYPNGCESAALYNLLKYYHVNVTMEQIVENLKMGSGPYLKNGTLYGGNPEIEFVGDPRDVHGYGVFQKPIIDVANKFKSGIIDYTGHSLDEVLSLVKKNIPVQVWGSIKNQDTKVCVSWIYQETNQKINWICNLHSIIIVGYHSKSVFVSDSYTGNIEEYDRKQFEKMYNLFGKRAIYYED